MKKIIIFAFAAAAFTVACTKASELDVTKEEVPQEVHQAIPMTITATIPEDIATKVTFTPNVDSGKPSKMTFTWEATETLRVYDHADHDVYVEFEYEASEAANVATFYCDDASDIAGASSYDVVVLDGKSMGDYNTQTQAEDNDTSHLKYISGKEDITDLTSIEFDVASSILAITAKMPGTTEAMTITSVDITASANIFNGTNTLTINLDSNSTDDAILNFYANLPGTQAVADGTTLLVHFNAYGASHDVYTRYIELGATEFTAGKLNTININATQSDQHAGLTSCDGSSAEKAYLIGDKYQMNAMHSLMVGGSTKYFKMIDDVDLDGITWTPLNLTDNFNKDLDFDGDGHTIYHLTTEAGSYSSFAGVLNGRVKDVIFDHASITAGANKAGVVCGYMGSNNSSVSGACSGVTVQNSTLTGESYLGGLCGQADKLSTAIDDCHVINTTVTSTTQRVGGLLGQLSTTAGYAVTNCTTEGVAISGNQNVGGLIGVCYGNVSNSSSSGTIVSQNTQKDFDIALGGLVGYFEGASCKISKCHSSATITQTTNGRDIGGLVGKMLAGTIEKSYATGDVSGIQRNVGGLVGLVTNTSNQSIISNCYATGSVTSGGYSGGLIGLHDKGTATITNCYATGDVTTTSFAIGGLVGVIGAAAFTMQNSAAWNETVSAGTHGDQNWSSGAVSGVTFPICTLTDNYRNPSMSLTAWWDLSDEGMTTYQHPNVATTSHPLVVKSISDGTLAETTATSTASGQPNRPQYAYHGKVETGKTLSQLASTTLGWSPDVWDFTGGDLPTLR